MTTDGFDRMSLIAPSISAAHEERYGSVNPFGSTQATDRRSDQRRSGGVLICVLVVLLIVGLLISQTVQTLLLVRRSDDQREQLRQARELIELGQIVLRQSDYQLPDAELIVPSAGENQMGRIAFTRIDSSDSTNSQVRITVNYRIGSTSEITATHVVADKEANHEATQ